MSRVFLTSLPSAENYGFHHAKCVCVWLIPQNSRTTINEMCLVSVTYAHVGKYVAAHIGNYPERAQIGHPKPTSSCMAIHIEAFLNQIFYAVPMGM